GAADCVGRDGAILLRALPDDAGADAAGAADCAGTGDERPIATGVTDDARAERISGGSSRKVYSRTSLPLPPPSSSSMSTNGSLIGCVDVTRMIGVPLRCSVAKRNDSSTGWRSILASR